MTAWLHRARPFDRTQGRLRIRPLLCVLPVAVRGRLRDDQEMNLFTFTRIVPHLVRCVWWDPDPFSSPQDYWTSIYFHDGFAREHVEELLRVMVKVTNLRCACRHALLNHAEFRILDQVPAITAVAPDVMLSG